SQRMRTDRQGKRPRRQEICLALDVERHRGQLRAPFAKGHCSRGVTLARSASHDRVKWREFFSVGETRGGTQRGSTVFFGDIDRDRIRITGLEVLVSGIVRGHVVLAARKIRERTRERTVTQRACAQGHYRSGAGHALKVRY